MAKILPFVPQSLRLDCSKENLSNTPKPVLTDEELQACTIARSLRELFTEKEIATMKKELEEVSDDT